MLCLDSSENTVCKRTASSSFCMNVAMVVSITLASLADLSWVALGRMVVVVTVRFTAGGLRPTKDLNSVAESFSKTIRL